MFSPEMNAKCSLPDFMLETEEDARICGKRKGKAMAIVFTIMILAFGIGMIFQLIKVSSETNKELAIEKRKLADSASSDIEKNKYLEEAIEIEKKSPLIMIIGIIIVMVISIIMVWVFTPNAVVNAAIEKFLLKDYERDAMKRSGLSNAEAFKQQQRLYESREQADSRRDAANITSRAYSRSIRDQTDVLRDAIRNKFY